MIFILYLGSPRSGKDIKDMDTTNLLVIGLKHDEFDTYDPENYDHNDVDYLDLDNKIEGKYFHTYQLSISIHVNDIKL